MEYGVGNVWGMMSEFEGKVGSPYTKGEEGWLYYYGFSTISTATNWGYDMISKLSHICPMVNEAGSEVVWFGLRYPVENWWHKANQVWAAMGRDYQVALCKALEGAGGKTQHTTGVIENVTYDRPAWITEEYKTDPRWQFKTQEARIIWEANEREKLRLAQEAANKPKPVEPEPKPKIEPQPINVEKVDLTPEVKQEAPKKPKWWQRLLNRLRGKD